MIISIVFCTHFYCLKAASALRVKAQMIDVFFVEDLFYLSDFDSRSVALMFVSKTMFRSKNHVRLERIRVHLQGENLIILFSLKFLNLQSYFWCNQRLEFKQYFLSIKKCRIMNFGP